MYYPPRIGTTKQLRALYPHNEIIDDDEEDWLEHLQVGRSRGKGAPKKKRTAAGTLTCIRGRVIMLIKNRVKEVQQAKVDDTGLECGVVKSTLYVSCLALYIYCKWSIQWRYLHLIKTSSRSIGHKTSSLIRQPPATSYSSPPSPSASTASQTHRPTVPSLSHVLAGSEHSPYGALRCST